MVCSAYQESLARRHGAKPQVIPLGVDPTQFQPGATANGPPWRLLHVADLRPVKNQALLLGAFRRLVDRQVDAYLDIVGADMWSGRMQELARQLGIDRRVIWHGFLPTDAVAPLYRRAHALVVTSRHEAAGVVILEAGASGLPVVGTSVGHLAEWTPDRGVAVASHDPVLLADAIDGLLRDRRRREELASAARGWTLAHDADWTAAQFESLYAALVSRA